MTPDRDVMADEARLHRATHADDITAQQLRAEADYNPEDWQ